jgi:hypothetical protein
MTPLLMLKVNRIRKGLPEGSLGEKPFVITAATQPGRLL